MLSHVNADLLASVEWSIAVLSFTRNPEDEAPLVAMISAKLVFE